MDSAMKLRLAYFSMAIFVCVPCTVVMDFWGFSFFGHIEPPVVEVIARSLGGLFVGGY